MSIIDAYRWVFPLPKEKKEIIREGKRKIARAVRDIERESLTLESRKRKLLVDAKKKKAEGHESVAKTLAMDACRTQMCINKHAKVISQLNSLSLTISQTSSSNTINTAMIGACVAIRKINKSTPVPVLMKVLSTFEQEIDKTSILQDLVGSSVEGAFLDTETEDEEEEQEISNVMNKISDEIGIELERKLEKVRSDTRLPERRTTKTAIVGGSTKEDRTRSAVSLNTSMKIEKDKKGGEKEEEQDDDIYRRLAALKRG